MTKTDTWRRRTVETRDGVTLLLVFIPVGESRWAWCLLCDKFHGMIVP